MAVNDWWMGAYIWMAAESWWMVARRASCGGGETTMLRTRNSKELDAKTSNSTRQDADVDSTSNTLKRKCNRPGLVVGWDERTLIVFLAFSWTVGMKMQSKLVNSKSHRAT